MTGPRLRATSVTIGTDQPLVLAHFYAKLLGWSVVAQDLPRAGEPATAGWAQLKPPAGEFGPTLNFEYEREFRAPVWPSRPGEQTSTQHLDIHAEDLPAAVEWAVSHGATLAAFQPQPDVRVLLDPSGHPFCLFN